MRKSKKHLAVIACAAAVLFSMNGVEASAATKKFDCGQVCVSVAQETVLRNNQLVQTMDSSSSGGIQWFENTGEGIPAGHTLDYSRYHLMDTVQVGDIIYNPTAGNGFIGHVAIVEGKFFDERTQSWYIRLVEATGGYGVIRCVLDDRAVDAWEAELYRVKNASEVQKQNAVNFCVNELGSGYSLDFGHDTSSSERDWYCSELVWAGYKNQGIDIEQVPWYKNEPGITPRDIARSSAVAKISFK